MRTKKPISRDDLMRSLEASKHDVDKAAAVFGVSGRTLRRRMAEYGIKPSGIRYEITEEAA